MYIVERFLSIQGEGKYAGKTAYFLRTAGCNFRCPGFGVEKEVKGRLIVGCDTIRAVYVNEFANTYEDFSPKVYEKELEALPYKPLVIITGGEPLLHYKNEQFYSFIKALLDKGYEVHFESNGSIFLDFSSFPLYKNCVFALGVKLSNSGMQEDLRISKTALENIIKNAKDYFLKFVLNKDENINKEVFKIQKLLNISAENIFCMPLGASKTELEENANYVFDFCLKHGFSYTDRLHIRLFNDKEGI